MKIAFLGFGEAARAFRESLAARDPTLRFTAYDLLLHKQGVHGDCGAGLQLLLALRRG